MGRHLGPRRAAQHAARHGHLSAGGFRRPAAQEQKHRGPPEGALPDGRAGRIKPWNFALPLPLSQKNLPEIVTSLRLHDRRNLGLQAGVVVGWVLPLLLACSSALADCTLAPVSFRNDVMAALSKAG